MVVPPGYGIGDFIAVGQLVWKVYKACKGAPSEFQELRRELSTLHTIIHELEDEARMPTSLLNRRGSNRKSELYDMLRNLSSVLEQIEDIAERYHSLGKDQKRAWDRIKFAGTDLATLRSKLLVHIGGINVFIASLSAGSLARIEGILDDLVRDIQEGKKEPSIISTHQTTDEAAWNELERELIGDGITKQDIETYKEDIKEYLKKLIQGGLAGIRSESVDLVANSLDSLQLWNGSPRLGFVDGDENGSRNGSDGFDPLRVDRATYASHLDGSLNEAELPQQDSWHTKRIEVEQLQYAGSVPRPFSTIKRKPLRPRRDEELSPIIRWLLGKSIN
ncbi:hypothetical protein EG329_005559 [Mollisiaceae sp. DMI_Dod_QoI]|nr:hypothetical protein EG329_005559 [Helotiales sp. DMI_Dod_QoI]